MFAEATLPPYRTGRLGGAHPPTRASRLARIVSVIADASMPDALRPVPIAQTGS